MTKKELIKKEGLNGYEIVIMWDGHFISKHIDINEAECKLYFMFILANEIDEKVEPYLDYAKVVNAMQFDWQIINLEDYSDDEELA